MLSNQHLLSLVGGGSPCISHVPQVAGGKSDQKPPAGFTLACTWGGGTSPVGSPRRMPKLEHVPSLSVAVADSMSCQDQDRVQPEPDLFFIAPVIAVTSPYVLPVFQMKILRFIGATLCPGSHG